MPPDDPAPSGFPERRRTELCPGCHKLIAREDITCPHCGASMLQSRPHAPLPSAETAMTWNTDIVIRTVIGLNIALYGLSLLLFSPSLGLLNPFSALSPSTRSLLLLGATGTVPIGQLGRWWTLVSAGYLHASLVHIVFNMLAFRQLGSLVGTTYGVNRMVILYVITGVGGFLASWLAGIEFTIGASASVCGLIGAAFYYGKSRGGPFGQAVYRAVSGWIIGLAIFGLMPGINNWGHAGGLVTGIACGWLLGYRERREEGPIMYLLALACAGGTLAILVWAVGHALYLRMGI